MKRSEGTRFPALTGDEDNEVTYGFIGFVYTSSIRMATVARLPLAPETLGDTGFVGVPVRAQTCALIWWHGDCDGREQK